MEKKMYYCKNCDKMHAEEAGKTLACPSCNSVLLETNITSKEWDNKPLAEKNEVLDMLSGTKGGTHADTELPGSFFKREEKNTIASVLSVIGWFLILIGIIEGIAIMSTSPYGDFSSVIGIATFVGGLVSGIFILGFAEIIHLLQKIYNKQD